MMDDDAWNEWLQSHTDKSAKWIVPSPLPEPAVSTKRESTYWQIEGGKKIKQK
jgi:hypothetical protein